MRSSAFLALAILAACSSPPAPEKKAEAPKPAAPPPEEYRVRLHTNEGDIVIAVHRKWAPRAADHFYDLVIQHFYDGSRFHRVVFPFVAQWGVAARPEINAIWNATTIPDEALPRPMPNAKGTVAFAKLGPASRTTQVFINLQDNRKLDKDGFYPFGEIVEGMDVPAKFYSFYGELAPDGMGPDSTRLQREGEAYLAAEFPRLDKIEKAAVLPAN